MGERNCVPYFPPDPALTPAYWAVSCVFFNISPFYKGRPPLRPLCGPLAACKPLGACAGGDRHFYYPKHVWTPSGGWWNHTPPGYKANLAVSVVAIGGILTALFVASSNNEVPRALCLYCFNLIGCACACPAPADCPSIVHPVSAVVQVRGQRRPTCETPSAGGKEVTLSTDMPLCVKILSNCEKR